MTDVAEVPLPRDARALCFAARLQAKPAHTGTIAALARQAGASRRTIERLFARETGLTVAEWRRRLRLLHTVRLLAEGEPVTTVALDIGYSSVSAFISVFKRAFGATPKNFRSQTSDFRLRTLKTSQ